MHATPELAEAGRLMTICNSCRYCEGLCAVFPAMEQRSIFEDGDLNYLANLCHNCGACYDDCQFSPPHEFSVNIPQTFAKVRAQSYRSYAWPAAFRPLFDHNGLAVAIVAALSVAAFVLGFVAAHDPSALFVTYAGRGAFYRLMPHDAMAWLFGLATIYVVVAFVMGLRNFWRDSANRPGEKVAAGALWQAVKDAASLRYLDGGGAGCAEDESPGSRKFYHHLTFWGFVLCFGSTLSATGYHYLLRLEAPYPWYDLPTVLGMLGGIGLVIGPAGLFRLKLRRDPSLRDPASFGMETAFIAMLFATGLTGLLLQVLRETPAMPLTLALHLGVVFALYLTMPYGKFVHGLYRFAALTRAAMHDQPAGPVS